MFCYFLELSLVGHWKPVVKNLQIIGIYFYLYMQYCVKTQNQTQMAKFRLSKSLLHTVFFCNSERELAVERNRRRDSVIEKAKDERRITLVSFPIMYCLSIDWCLFKRTSWSSVCVVRGYNNIVPKCVRVGCTNNVCECVRVCVCEWVCVCVWLQRCWQASLHFVYSSFLWGLLLLFLLHCKNARKKGVIEFFQR
jgi:hypothetical protein